MKTSIVLVCYKTPRETIRCLESIFLGCSNCSYDIWVVVNDGLASSYNIINGFCAGKEHINIVVSENYGFAAACNKAIALIREMGGSDSYWLLNNDCVVASDCLSQMRAVLGDGSRIGIVGCAIKKNDGRLQCLGGGRLFPILGIQRQYGWGRRHADMLSEFDIDKLAYISGASMLISNNLVDDIGVLNENFFMYWEETEFCMRATKAGWMLGVAKNGVVVHDIGASTGISSALTEYYSTRNGIVFFRYFYPKGWGGRVSEFILIFAKVMNRARRWQWGRIVTLIMSYRSAAKIDVYRFMGKADNRYHDFKKNYK